MAVLVDLQPLMIVSYKTLPENEREERQFHHAFFDRLFNGVLPFHKEYGQVILCAEGEGKSWRKEIYPEYKANRRRGKTDDEQKDYEKMLGFFNELTKEIELNKVFRVLKVDGAEADDIIGVLCSVAEKPTLIVSSDKDFQQLQINKNIKQYSLAYKKWVECENPSDFLIEHIVRGDTSDNIPNIRKELYKEGELGSEKRAPITKKFLSEFMNGKNFDEYSRRFRENKKLIDLSQIPDEIKERIVVEIGKEWHKDNKRAIDYFRFYYGMGKFAEQYLTYGGF